MDTRRNARAGVVLPFLQIQRVWIDPHLRKAASEIGGVSPVRCYLLPIQQPRSGQPVNARANSSDSSDVIRLLLQPGGYSSLCLGHPQAATAGNDYRVQHERVGDCVVGLKRDAGFGSEWLLVKADDGCFVQRAGLAFGFINSRSCKSIDRSDEVERHDPVETQETYAKSFHDCVRVRRVV